MITKGIIGIIIILLVFSLFCGCGNNTKNKDLHSSATISKVTTDNSAISSSNVQPLVKMPFENDPQRQLTNGEFIWLWMDALDNHENPINSITEAVGTAEEYGYIQKGINIDAPITIQEAAFLMFGTVQNVRKLEYSHYDWQIFDLEQADDKYKLSLLTAYSKGLFTTINVNIHPKDALLLKDATLVLSRIMNAQGQILPPDCNAPYFEYQGLVELIRLDPAFIIDLKYTTADNFTGVKHYSRVLCLSEVDTAKMLLKANQYFNEQGFTIKIWDAYRPVSVQWSLYNATPDNLKSYAPAPSPYSQHSKGIATDITLVDNKGKEILMPTNFDSFDEKAHPDYANLPKQVIDNRNHLISGMQKQGFIVDNLEWWHFYNPSKTILPISEVTLDGFVEKRNEFYQKCIGNYFLKNK